jgi:DNA-binding NarL/FixJ family response regulator
MPFWDIIRRIFGYRLIHIQQPILDELQYLAELHQMSQETVAAELLAQALEQQQDAGAQFKYWRMLTRREQDVTALACLGYTNAEIAAQLSISTTTVSTHMRNILGKLGLRSKAELRQFFFDLDFEAWVE